MGKKVHTFCGDYYWSNLNVFHDEKANTLTFYFHFKPIGF